MNVKKLIGKVHLWLGLSSGLLVFIVAITDPSLLSKKRFLQFFIPNRCTRKYPPTTLKHSCRHFATGYRLLYLVGQEEENR